MQTKAKIHSLNGELDTVTIIKHTDCNNVIAEYKSELYTAVFNPFVGAYYVDDIYGHIPSTSK